MNITTIGVLFNTELNNATQISMKLINIVGGKFIFDMASISNTDIEAPEWKKKLEASRKGEEQGEKREEGKREKKGEKHPKEERVFIAKICEGSRHRDRSNRR